MSASRPTRGYMDDADLQFLVLLTKSADPVTAADARDALDRMTLKWTYNANQSRVGGRFASGSGGNQTMAKPPKPINAAAAPRAVVNPAAARAAAPPVVVPARPATPTGTATTPRVVAAPKPAPAPAKPVATGPSSSLAGQHGGDSASIGHRSTRQTALRDSLNADRQRGTEARTRQADIRNAASLAAAKARLAAIPKLKPATNAQRDAAEKKMLKAEGIPKKLPKHTSAERRKAVSQMKSAARKLVTYKAEQKAAAAQVAALETELKNAKDPKTKAWAQSHLSTAQSHLGQINSKVKTTQGQFNTAAKTYHRK